MGVANFMAASTNPKFNKCEFWLDKLGFLRHIVLSDGIYMKPKKVKAMSNWEHPMIVTKVQSFLDLASYYNHFIERFSKIMGPLHYLT